jgi:hypothetical protein
MGGVRVRHGHHARDPARRRGQGAGLNGFGAFVAGFPEMDMNVHKARGDNEARGVKHLGPRRGRKGFSQSSDLAVFYQKIEDLVPVVGRIDDPPPLIRKGVGGSAEGEFMRSP